MLCISGATAAGSDIADSSLFSEEEVRISKIKVLPQLPVGPKSLLIQIVPNLVVRRLVASFLTSRCTMCDENKAFLIKDRAGVFRFYCIDCFMLASECEPARVSEKLGFFRAASTIVAITVV